MRPMGVRRAHHPPVDVEAVQQPHHEHHRHDEAPRAPEEAREALPGVEEDVLQAGTVVGRQFHDEVRRFAAEEGLLEGEAREDAQDDAREVEHQEKTCGGLGAEGDGEGRVDGHLRAAAHERDHEDGEHAVPLRFQGPRRRWHG